MGKKEKKQLEGQRIRTDNQAQSVNLVWILIQANKLNKHMTFMR